MESSPPPHENKPPTNFPKSSPSPKLPRRPHGSSCAACKFQCKRCPPDCILPPYFPNNNPAQFSRVHKLFGVHNLIRALDAIPPELREVAVSIIVFEANARAADPIGGCYRFVIEIGRQIEDAEAELQFVQRCIQLVRSRINAGDQDVDWNLSTDSGNDQDD